MDRMQLELFEGSLFSIGEIASLAIDCECLIRHLDGLH